MLNPDERSIDLDVVVPAPADAIWDAWTTQPGVITFFGPQANVELRIDGPYEILFHPFAETGSKGGEGCRVLAWQPQRMLSFTWNAPPHLPEVRHQHTHVTIRLYPEASGSTRVVLRHVGWGSGGQWDEAFAYFQEAWPVVLGRLQRRFAEGPVDWSEYLERRRQEMGK
jgi:uncharacterized protein YndB with AHSA1/START domain